MKRRQAQRKRFQEVALPHLNALYRTACQMVGQDTAPDLVQETFLRAWKYFDSFDAGTNCRAWLFRILRNGWITNWQKRRLELPCVDVEIEQIEAYYDWEDDFLKEELSAEVQEALSGLPEDYRMAVLLADVEEFSYRDIAHIMDCPIGTVMSRINRGRRLLGRLIRARRASSLPARPAIVPRQSSGSEK